MKKTIIALALVGAALTAGAMPVKPGMWRTLTLADGTTVKAELTGDENMTFWRTADGACYRQDTNGKTFTKVTAALLQQELDGILKQKEQRAKAIEAALPKRSPAKDSGKYTGKKKCLVILANFADTKFKPEHTLELYKQIINGENYTNEELGFRGSVADYFKAQSSGQFEIDFDVVGPVELPKGYAAYGKNDASGRDQAELVYPMVENTVTLAKDLVSDWAQYDWDGDGLVEEVFVLYAGHGQATYPQDGDLVWPHKSQIDPLTVANGVAVSVYACSCELGATEAIDGIGAFCHEFSHCLGLKDHYDINNVGYGTGYWDLMCYGCYNGNSFVPAGYNAYEKMFCGWQQPVELNADPVQVDNMKALAEGGDTYVFYNDATRNEYYMVENRQKTAWDAELPGQGIIVTHVDYDQTAWEYNQVNYVASRQRMTVIPADNDFGSTADNRAADAWPYNGNNSLSNYSRPAAEVYNTNTDGSLMMNKFLMNMTQNADGTVSFLYTTKAAMKPDKPEEALLYDTFDNCSGTGGNDGLWGGDNIGTGDFIPDTDGWTGTPKTGANKCALFGNATRKANVATPAFTIAEPCTVSFLAAPYTGSADNKLLLSANYGCDATLSETEFTLTPGQWTEVRTTVTGSGSISLRIKTNSAGVFVDNVCILPQSYDGINTVDSNASVPHRTFTLDGRRISSTAGNLAKGIYIIDGKKTVKQ